MPHIFDRFTKKLQLYHLEKNLNSEERRKINSNQRSFTCNRTNKFFFSLYLINTRERAKGMPRGGPPRSNEATVLSSKEISSSLNLPLSLSLSVSLSLSWLELRDAEVPRLETNSCSSAKLTLVPQLSATARWNKFLEFVNCSVCSLESSRLPSGIVPAALSDREREREREKEASSSCFFARFVNSSLEIRS